jgi:hypothetical protein
LSIFSHTLSPAADASAGALSGNHRRAAAEKGVEHDLAARRAIEDRIGDHRHRFHGRVQRQEIALATAAGEGPRVTLDRHVVGWVGKHHRGAFLAHQQGEGAGIEGVGLPGIELQRAAALSVSRPRGFAVKGANNPRQADLRAT